MNTWRQIFATGKYTLRIMRPGLMMQIKFANSWLEIRRIVRELKGEKIAVQVFVSSLVDTRFLTEKSIYESEEDTMEDLP